MQRWTSKPLDVPDSYARADLGFHGIDHSGDSFTVWIFLNSPHATLETSPADQQGFAGHFSVFGHGHCYGDDPSHCQPAGPVSPFDRRPPHPLEFVDRTATITDGLRKLASTTVTITVLADIASSDRDRRTDDILVFDELTLVTYE